MSGEDTNRKRISDIESENRLALGLVQSSQQWEIDNQAKIAKKHHHNHPSELNSNNQVSSQANDSVMSGEDTNRKQFNFFPHHGSFTEASQNFKRKIVKTLLNPFASTNTTPIT